MSPQETWASTAINTSTQKLAQEGPVGAGVNHAPRGQQGNSLGGRSGPGFPSSGQGLALQRSSRGTVEGGLSPR